MQISKKGIELIKEFEGFSEEPYMCPGGYMTIGYGHRIRQHIPKITKEQAEELLREDIKAAIKAVKKHVKVDISQGQFDALVSLVFNWGTGNFRNSWGLKALNDNDYEHAAHEFFSKKRGVVKVGGEFSSGLYRRRKAEHKLWLRK